VKALVDHGLDGAIDVALIDPSPAGDIGAGLEPVDASPGVLERVRSLGVEVVTAPLSDPSDARHHSHALLRAALEGVV
jgi:hypothetical protein